MRTIAVVLVALLAGSLVQAQSKIGHFSSEAIIKQLPDAQDAQKQLDQLTTDWQAEYGRMQSEFRKKLDDYERRKLIMTDLRRAEAEKELQELEKKMMDYRNQKFGPSGELFAKQNELMKPVQDRIFAAVQAVAEEEEFDYIFDKSGEILLMYANATNDLTDKIFAKVQLTTTTRKP